MGAFEFPDYESGAEDYGGEEDVGAISGLEEATRKVVVECYVKSLEYCHLVSFGCAILALLVGLTIREKPLH